METKNFKFVMVLLTVLTSMMFVTSCDKDEPLPVVKNSTVEDNGLAQEVTVKTRTKVTELSYESWILVKGEFRASDEFEKKVSIMLKNSLPTAKSKQYINDYKYGEVKTSINYKRGEVTAPKRFVTLTDSVLVYTVSYDNFSFSYNLVYQVPEYNDGQTKVLMPYHRYGKIIDKGGKFEVLDSKVEGSSAYARKKYTHTIGVEFNGKVYNVKAEVILKRRIGDANKPFIVRSKLISKAFDDTNGKVESVIEVKRTWNNGRVETKIINVQLNRYLSFFDGTDKSISPLKYYNDDLELKETYLQNGTSRWLDSDRDKFVKLNCLESNLVLQYNYFSITADATIYEAVYDDGVLVLDFPAPKTEFINSRTNVIKLVINNDELDGYYLKQEMIIKCGGYEEKELISFTFHVYK